MANLTPVLACICFGVIALSGPGLIGMYYVLPPWLLAPLLRFQKELTMLPMLSFQKDQAPDADAVHGLSSSRPEDVLLQRLEKVDAARDPETAHSLHAAIGNVLRASGTQSERALRHFEFARDAAVRGTDPDTHISARLELAEAYIDAGRPRDSQRELAKASGLLPNHFAEVRPRLNRGHGRAKFEQGFTKQALSYFEEAAEHAMQPQDKVHIACDIAMARTCLGQASNSLQPLRAALEVLHADRKEGPDGGLPAAVHSDLTEDVHFRLAEAFHSIKDATFAKAHYEKALHLEQRSQQRTAAHSIHQGRALSKAERIAAIQRGIELLDEGTAPELHCPSLRPPWEGAPKNMKLPSFASKINRLIAEQKYDAAEKELKNALRTHSRPYDNLETATALNMLGNLYRKQSSFSKAAAQFRQALHAVIVCCGAEHQDAKAAYEGLRDVKSELAPDEQRVASAAISRYFDVLSLKKHGTSAINPGETSAEEVAIV